MTMRVFFFNTLAAGVGTEDYERWVLECDYPTARSIPSIQSYEVIHLDASLQNGPVPFDYVEVVEITSIDAYQADLASLPGREAFIGELRSFIGESVAVYGSVIE